MTDNPWPALSARPRLERLAGPACSLLGHAAIAAALVLSPSLSARHAPAEVEIPVEIVVEPEKPSVATQDTAAAAPPEHPASVDQTDAQSDLPKESEPAPPSAVADAVAEAVPDEAPAPADRAANAPATSPQQETEEASTASLTAPPTPEPSSEAPTPSLAPSPLRMVTPLKPRRDLPTKKETKRTEAAMQNRAERVREHRNERQARTLDRGRASRSAEGRQPRARVASLDGATPAKGGGAAAGALSAPAYRAQVIAHLTRFKRYPMSAEARGAEGTPAVSFSLDGSGRVTSAALARSSGHSDIDAETLGMVRRAVPFPAPPPGTPHAFTVSIGFHLQ